MPGAARGPGWFPWDLPVAKCHRKIALLLSWRKFDCSGKLPARHSAVLRNDTDRAKGDGHRPAFL